jgi:hypothetical protein
MNAARRNWIANFIRGIADDMLRDLYKRLAFTVTYPALPLLHHENPPRHQSLPPASPALEQSRHGKSLR